MLASCAGWQRDCDSCMATSVGADWIVVQYSAAGHPFNCWQLKGVGITNEHASDGIFWVDSKSGNLVHISGWYNRVQVGRWGSFEDAAVLSGVDLKRCVNGHYLDPPKVTTDMGVLEGITIPPQKESSPQ